MTNESLVVSSSENNKLLQSKLSDENCSSTGISGKSRIEGLPIADGDIKNNMGIVIKKLEEYIVREWGEEPPRSEDTFPSEGE